MKKWLALLVVALVSAGWQRAPSPEQARLARIAQGVTITRDDWGIAHVHGRTDAEAVFGMIYAQAEDDFNRVETNFINAMGRLAEVDGEAEIWRDLRMKLFIDPLELKKQYESSPAWLKALMNGWADGLNYYLATHPAVKPRVITRFEPWMALSFSEGSIGGDIEKVNLAQLQAFYSGAPSARHVESVRSADRASVREPDVESVRSADRALVRESDVESVRSADRVSVRESLIDFAAAEGPPRRSGETQIEFAAEAGGSNGIAVAPSNTTAKRALLLINPHTSFFFRSELQVTSDEGLNAYGAATWGQFFIYQGFNERVGWMHTTSGVDDLDEYLETVTPKGDGYVYKYGVEERPLTTSVIKVPYKTPSGMAERTFTVYRTHHGPIVRAINGKWVAFALMQEPVKALTQSYLRTKATDHASFKQTMELHTNSSNNTIFASSKGEIAYFHGNFIPRRDPRFDWTRPVDGSDPATDWKGLLSVDESPNLFNPASGWLYNANDAPWTAAGASSRKRADFPAYVENGTESARGRHAVRVLDNRKDFTLDGLIAAAYDSYQPWFEQPLPALIKAWDALPAGDALKQRLADQVALLRAWDLRWGASSIPTSLGVFWADEVQRTVATTERRAGLTVEEYLGTKAPGADLLKSLAAASDKLTADFGSWKTPWGEINRFQRLTDDLVHPFTDAGPSIPVMFTTGTLGSLASFSARPYRGSKKLYGTSGNSFVAVVEFGPTIRAKAVTAGGESGDPKSKHFNDQAERYATGNLRDVYFYPAQLTGHTERTYRPGR